MARRKHRAPSREGSLIHFLQKFVAGLRIHTKGKFLFSALLQSAAIRLPSLMARRDFRSHGILSRILRLGSKGDASANEVRSQYYAPSRFAAHIGLGTKAGVGVTEEGALALSAVYSCVRLIASSLASLDLHLHRVEGAQRQIASDHPVYQIVNSMPAEGMTAYDFFEHIISDALLHGQGYALIERGEVTGRPVQLHLLTADKMRKHNHEGQTVYTHADIPQHVFPDDLLIIRCFRGISPYASTWKA